MGLEDVVFMNKSEMMVRDFNTYHAIYIIYLYNIEARSEPERQDHNHTNPLRLVA